MEYEEEDDTDLNENTISLEEIDEAVDFAKHTQQVALELTKLIAKPNEGNSRDFVLETFTSCIKVAAETFEEVTDRFVQPINE